MRQILFFAFFSLSYQSLYGFGFILHPINQLLRPSKKSFDRELCIERPTTIYGSFPIFEVSAGEIHTFYINPYQPRSLDAAKLLRKPVTRRILRFHPQPAGSDESFVIHKLLACIPNEAYLKPSYPVDLKKQFPSNPFRNKQK